MEEERDCPRRTATQQGRAAPQGQGLNDLYVRFFRMAERRIVEKTGKGIVCFISNYSWLDGLPSPGCASATWRCSTIWIDCLNGDKYKTGKLTPEGKPDPSIFSTEFNREGIQVGTAIALLARTSPSEAAKAVRFRHLWGKEKRDQLLAEATGAARRSTRRCGLRCRLGLPFAPTQIELVISFLAAVAGSVPGVVPGREDQP